MLQGVKKNVAELEDSSRNYPKQRNTKEKREEALQGPLYTLRNNGLCEEDLGPGESGNGRAPAASEPPRAPRELQGPQGLPWLLGL